MGFMRVFRFIFLGVGLFFAFIGGLLYLAFTNPSNDFLVKIAEYNPKYDEKMGLVFMIIGGALLVLSILFFVIYGIKGNCSKNRNNQDSCQFVGSCFKFDDWKECKLYSFARK